MTKHSRPLDWHLDCLNNWKQSLEKDAAQLVQLQKNLEEARERFAFYEKQIAEAQRRGKTDFDRDRFLIVKRSSTKNTKE